MHIKHLVFVLLFLKICDANISLTFVIDRTGSMHDVIDETITASKNILKSVIKSNSSRVDNFVLISYKDPEVNVSKISEDPDEFRSALTELSQQVGGGKDCPEYSMTAIEIALRNSKQESFIYVFTDASAKDYMRVDIVNQLIQKLQSRVIFVLTGECTSRDSSDYQVYQQVANISSGQVFQCDKNEVGKVLETIPILLNGKSSILTSSYLTKGIKYFTFNVDDRTDTVTVSILGENVVVHRIDGPDRKPLTYSMNILDNIDTKIFKLNSLRPGVHIVHISSDIGTRVVVHGKTTIDFQQGFSEFKPKSIIDTSRQPIKDQKTRLSVDIEDPNMNFELQEVQILTIQDIVLRKVSVTKNGDHFYVSEPFIPPNHLFKICILGKDKVSGGPIRRLGKTFIEPQKPELVPVENKKPIVKIPEGTTVEVEYGSDVKISCHISAYPEPEVTWQDQSGNILTSKATAVEFPYDYVSYLEINQIQKPDKYLCKAKNSEESNYGNVHIIIKPFLKIVGEPKNQSIELGKDGMLLCNVISNLPVKIKWYIDDNEIHTDDKFSISLNKSELTLKHVDDNHIGVYKCEVDNGVENKVLKAKVDVTGMEPPKISSDLIKLFQPQVSDNVTLLCSVDGKPKPKIKWFLNGRQLSSGNKYTIEPDNSLFFVAEKKDSSPNYECIASNKLGTVNYTSEVSVLTPAAIVNNPQDNPYVAIIGDYVIKVPCEVEGNPYPNIVWKNNGKVMVSDHKYKIDSNKTIIIKNPKENVNFTCFAENIYGHDERTFQVHVNEFVDIEIDSERIYLLKGENKHIKCPIKNTNDDERWFKNGNFIFNGEFNINNASVFDDGNYTCRVSNMEGSRSYPLYIDVGWPPKPIYDDYGTIEFNETTKLHCDVDVKPRPIILWWKNEEILKNKDEDSLRIDHWGDYRCFVEGVHGNFSRKFKVIAKDCFIKFDPATNDVSFEPLLLDSKSKWLDNIKENYINIKSESMVKLICPNKNESNYIELFKQPQVKAQCKSGDQFYINGSLYTFSELKCTKQLESTMKKTKEKCLYENSELINVGFETLNVSINVYDICIDKEKRIPLYTKVKLTSRDYINITVMNYTWTTDLSANVNYDHIYDCNTQRSKFRNIFQNLSNNCCITKVQFVEPIDLYGPMQLTTFNYLNTVPVWNNYNGKSNWMNLKNNLRTKAIFDGTYIIWMGSSEILQLADEFNVSRNVYLDDDNKIPVPLYLWMVMLDIDEMDVAVIYVNVPYLKGDVIGHYKKCEDISSEIDWLKDISSKEDQGGYIYSCSLDDFTKAFNISASIFHRE